MSPITNVNIADVNGPSLTGLSVDQQSGVYEIRPTAGTVTDDADGTLSLYLVLSLTSGLSPPSVKAIVDAGVAGTDFGYAQIAGYVAGTEISISNYAAALGTHKVHVSGAVFRDVKEGDTVYPCLLAVDASANMSTAPVSAISPVQDRTAPTLSGFAATSSNEVSLTLEWNVSDGGDAAAGSNTPMYIGLYSSASAPTTSQVVAGAGTDFLRSITIANSRTTASTVVGNDTPLAPSTTYYLYAVAVDSSGNAPDTPAGPVVVTTADDPSLAIATVVYNTLDYTSSNATISSSYAVSGVGQGALAGDVAKNATDIFYVTQYSTPTNTSGPAVLLRYDHGSKQIVNLGSDGRYTTTPAALNYRDLAISIGSGGRPFFAQKFYDSSNSRYCLYVSKYASGVFSQVGTDYGYAGWYAGEPEAVANNSYNARVACDVATKSVVVGYRQTYGSTAANISLFSVAENASASTAWTKINLSSQISCLDFAFAFAPSGSMYMIAVTTTAQFKLYKISLSGSAATVTDIYTSPATINGFNTATYANSAADIRVFDDTLIGFKFGITASCAGYINVDGATHTVILPTAVPGVSTQNTGHGTKQIDFDSFGNMYLLFCDMSAFYKLPRLGTAWTIQQTITNKTFGNRALLAVSNKNADLLMFGSNNYYTASANITAVRDPPDIIHNIASLTNPTAVKLTDWAASIGGSVEAAIQKGGATIVFKVTVASDGQAMRLVSVGSPPVVSYLSRYNNGTSDLWANPFNVGDVICIILSGNYVGIYNNGILRATGLKQNIVLFGGDTVPYAYLFYGRVQYLDVYNYPKLIGSLAGQVPVYGSPQQIHSISSMTNPTPYKIANWAQQVGGAVLTAAQSGTVTVAWKISAVTDGTPCSVAWINFSQREYLARFVSGSNVYWANPYVVGDVICVRMEADGCYTTTAC